MKKKPNYNRFTYYATSNNMKTVYESKGYRIEGNLAIGMYRINSDNPRLRNRKWFINHMGYTPHYPVLLEALDRLDA
jgi:hypothetical protein